MSIELGIHKHYKGGHYEVIHIGRNSNDCNQELVIYQSLEDGDYPAGTIWVRPVTNFTNPPSRFVKINEPCKQAGIICQTCYAAPATMQIEGDYVCINCAYPEDP